MKRSAFTMIELIFVIVIMGIIGKFGTEFLAQAYESFIFSNTNNKLQARSAKAVEFISSRLQYRIKDSVIARTGTVAAPGAPIGIGNAGATANIRILEWVSTDIDGFRGVTNPYWSGIIDLNPSTANRLASPRIDPITPIINTDTALINALIQTLSDGNSTIADAALYFIGSNSDATTSYGYQAGGLTDQSGAMHPINSDATPDGFISSIAGVNFAGVDLYEYYKLAWTANAIVWSAANGGTLTYYYNYQPWNNIHIANAKTKSRVIMEGISTFQFMSIGSIIKIQVCAGDNLVEDYSLCKEKTIF